MAQVRFEGTEILRVLCGSRAYGLHDENSDHDYHSIFVIPTARLLEIGPPVKETAWNEGDSDDNTGWELKHFLNLAMHGNPTVLETFVAPVEHATDIGLQLRSLFPHVLTRKPIYDAFRGYAKNQRTKMFDPKGDDIPQRTAKAAVAYLRSLHHGRDLLETGTYDPKIPEGTFRNFLLDLRKGRITRLAPVVEWAELLESEIAFAFLRSSVRLEPDLNIINAFLLRIRREVWQ